MLGVILCAIQLQFSSSFDLTRLQRIQAPLREGQNSLEPGQLSEDTSAI